MEILDTAIPEVKILKPKKFGDARGFFSETYSRQRLADAGLDFEFVQDNQSLSVAPGVLRGLHYQLPPFAQTKLVRVVRGAILDVAVDIRRGSPTFGKHAAMLISAENWSQALIPVGFAHGFLTLEPNTEVVYKVTDYYSPTHERGLAWNDPDVAIAWGCATPPVLSDKDAKNPFLRDAVDLFD
ncbi:MAG: dTDP-4-dehydrorhamnose 3,5-epimerase [Planctomycetia bacterium]